MYHHFLDLIRLDFRSPHFLIHVSAGVPVNTKEPPSSDHTNLGCFGTIPVRSGRFGPGHFGLISGVSRFGPVGAGRFGPIA